MHFLQIWITPEEKGLEPGYEQISLEREAVAGRLKLIALSEPLPGAVHIHQDAAIYAARLKPGDSAKLPLAQGRRAYMQVAQGEFRLNGYPLKQGDATMLVEEQSLQLDAYAAAEVLVFDLA